MDYVKYYNQEHSIELHYPSDWERIDGFAGTLVSFLSPYENKKDKFRDLMNVIFVEFFHPALDILEEFSMRSLKELDKEIDDFEILIPIADTKLSGLSAKELYYHQKQDGLALKSYSIWTIYEYRAYILSSSAMQKDFERYKPLFDGIVESFIIYEAKNPPPKY